MRARYDKDASRCMYACVFILLLVCACNYKHTRNIHTNTRSLSLTHTHTTGAVTCAGRWHMRRVDIPVAVVVAVAGRRRRQCVCLNACEGKHRLWDRDAWLGSPPTHQTTKPPNHPATTGHQTKSTVLTILVPIQVAVHAILGMSGTRNVRDTV